MSIPVDTIFLVAEDDPTTRKELVENIRELGFQGQIIEAENGKEAFEIFQKEGKKLQFIISDMVMPISSGYDFLVQVRKDPNFQQLPFLMLTSKSDREIVLKCVQAKVSNYLVKPWNLQTLGEKIHSCWAKHNS